MRLDIMLQLQLWKQAEQKVLEQFGQDHHREIIVLIGFEVVNRVSVIYLFEG